MKLIAKIKGLENPKGSLISQGENDASELAEEGNESPLEMLVQARQAQEYLKGFLEVMGSYASDEIYSSYSETEAKAGLTFGSAKVTIGNTGERLNYEEDQTYKSLQADLKARAEDLKHARKSEGVSFDADSAEIPKVSLKSPSKQVLKVTL